MYKITKQKKIFDGFLFGCIQYNAVKTTFLALFSIYSYNNGNSVLKIHVELPLMNVYMYDNQKNIFHFAEYEIIQ